MNSLFKTQNSKIFKDFLVIFKEKMSIVSKYWLK